jgi:peptide/nickel transport system ATP-binding protein
VNAPAPLVSVRDVSVRFASPRGGTFRAVEDVTLAIQTGEALGLVGESGCGKSTLSRAIVRLVEVEQGSIAFSGQDITKLAGSPLRALRRRVQIVFQDSGAALNPRHTIETALREPLEIHALHTDRRGERIRELLTKVGLHDDVLARYPHELSGGQKQRVGIARALAVEPELIVLDEPVSALDASVRAQVMNLLADLQQELRLTYLFVSHDLAMVRQLCARTAVMYLGRIVEEGPTDDVLLRARHPYTKALRASVPSADPTKRRTTAPLAGEPASALSRPPGCAFAPRCPDAIDDCKKAVPPLVQLGPSHVACIRAS